MFPENSSMQTFKETNIPELQILAVKTTFSGQTMLITVVCKAHKLRELTFHDELITHLIETGNHSNANFVVCGDFNQGFKKSLQSQQSLLKLSLTWPIIYSQHQMKQREIRY